jgi:hypothetical protein
VTAPLPYPARLPNGPFGVDELHQLDGQVAHGDLLLLAEIDQLAVQAVAPNVPRSGARRMREGGEVAR